MLKILMALMAVILGLGPILHNFGGFRYCLIKGSWASWVAGVAVPERIAQLSS